MRNGRAKSLNYFRLGADSPCGTLAQLELEREGRGFLRSNCRNYLGSVVSCKLANSAGVSLHDTSPSAGWLYGEGAFLP
jgi:hypothetical protein